MDRVETMTPAHRHQLTAVELAQEAERCDRSAREAALALANNANEPAEEVVRRAEAYYVFLRAGQ